jgi:outer membrane protein OmpA-like peptidoglycan-associated protein
MIGRSKTLQIISRKEFAKVIKRNARRGYFGTTTPVNTIPPVKQDTMPPPKDVVNTTSNPVEPVPVSDPILKADSLITLNEFLFETNSYKLRPEHFPELNSLSNFLKSHPTLEVDISGHTDSTGDERHNVTLSTRRAESVAEYLVGKGVNYDKVVFRGLGSSKPLMGNETIEGRSKNRRVEILISNPNR